MFGATYLVLENIIIKRMSTTKKKKKKKKEKEKKTQDKKIETLTLHCTALSLFPFVDH